MLSHLLLLGAVALPTDHGQTPGGSRVVTAHRVTPATGAPAVDGRLNDAVWAAADSIDGFTQRQPDEGRASRYRTVARIAFDQEAVYVAVRAYDPEPHRISAQLTRRDEDSPSDWLMVALDSRHDQRTAYVFSVNPAGVKRDFIVAEGQDDDEGWDAVWSAATTRDSLGWTAEYRIPLAALRFAPDGDGVWGFNLVRSVARDREESFWAPIRRDEPRLVAAFGELHGMRGLPSPRRLELLPYTVSGVARSPGDAGDPFHRSNDLSATAGLDVKYGLTSDLTLDATVNPDFGQVEADPSQVNLSAFETFLDERRPFFTEGAEIYRFGLGLGDDDSETLFYSRRIGRSPHGGIDGDYVDAPAQTDILGAAKLSGRVAGWSVGVLEALTAEERAHAATGGLRSSAVVEPFTSYTVLRARRDLNGGRTQLGAVGTNVYRSLDGTGLDWLHRTATTGGFDLSHRWGGGAYVAQLWAVGSHVTGEPEALEETQRSSARYYQRPDADYVELDPTATSLSGYAANYMVMKQSGRWRAGVLGSLRSPGFEANDLGYQQVADRFVNVFYGGYRRYPQKGFAREVNANLNAWEEMNFGGEKTSLAGNVNGSITLRNYVGIWGGLRRNFEALDTRATRGGPAMRAPARYGGWLGMDSNSRKKVYGQLGFDWGREPESGGWNYAVSVEGVWRPTPGIRLEAEPFYQRSLDGWQYVGQPEDRAGSTRYLFGDLDQRVAGMELRANQTFSPTLSLQLYAQPFVATGRYADFRQVASPRAERFADRLSPLAAERGTADDPNAWRVGPADDPELTWDNPDFNVRDFNLNAVLRWEYRLGSTLFVAWSHSRGAGANDPDGLFRLGRELDALWSARATNVLVIKANYWINL